MSERTGIVKAIERGEPAAGRLFPLVYDDLRRAAARMAGERPGHTLQPTAPVHEVFLRLVGSPPPVRENRRHFFVAAAEAMCRVSIDVARRKKRVHHGRGRRRVGPGAIDVPATSTGEDPAAVAEALEAQAGEESAAPAVIRLRYPAGLTAAETADALGLSERTVHRHRAYARASFYQRLSDLPEPADG